MKMLYPPPRASALVDTNGITTQIWSGWFRRIVDIYNGSQTALKFASLPTTPQLGQSAFITDSTTSTFNAAAGGGGTINIPVFYDGTIWRVG